MKYVTVTVGLLAILWASVLFIYGAQLNIVYLCSRASDIQKTADTMAINERSIYIASQIAARTYAPQLRNFFEASSTVVDGQHEEIVRVGLAEFMGPDYACPELSNLLLSMSADDLQ